MTEKSWPWSTVAALGDGAAQLSEALSREFLALYFLVQDPTVEGVSKGVLNELAVSGTATPISIATGSGVCYGLYINDAVVTKAIATPAVGTTGFRVVLQTNWAGTGGGSLEARTRIAVKVSADGVAGIPALTQSFGTTWEISLATGTITTGGVIALTDTRVFRRSTAVIGGAQIDDDSVGNTELRNSAAVSVIGRAANSAGDPADIAAGANDRLLARVGDALSFVQLTIGMIPDALITLAKMANLAAVSVLGRAANSSGVMAAIAAAANDRLLRRTGDTLNFGQLTAGMFPAGVVPVGGLADGAVNATAKLANDIVDDTKVGNRVPQFYRRQGGDASDWSLAGNTTHIPTTVREQVGSKAFTSGSTVIVTFPVAFSQPPIVTASVLDETGGAGISLSMDSVTATTVQFRPFKTDGTTPTEDFAIHWRATGPE